MSSPHHSGGPSLRLAVVAGWVLATLPASAALDWREARLELVSRPFQAQLSGAFAFTNPGGAEVRFLGAESSCDCTRVALPTQPVGAKATGELPVSIDLRGKAGRFSAAITVTTSEGPAQLRVNVTIQEPASFSRQMLVWRTGEPATEMEVAITLHSAAVHLTLEPAAGERFFAVRLSGGERPRLSVTPLDTTVARTVVIPVVARLGDESKKFLVYAAIK